MDLSQFEREPGGGPFLIPANLIRRNIHQPRQTFVKSELVELADSIKENGQRTPAEVRILPAGLDHLFELVEGERRWRSVTTHIDPAFVLRCVIVEPKNEADQFEQSITGNLHRADVPPLDTAFAIQRLKLKYGRPLDHVARLYKKSTSWVQDQLLLITLPKEIRDMLDPNLPEESRLDPSIAIIIAKMKEKSRRIPLAELAVRDGLSLRAVKVIIRGVDPDALGLEPKGLTRVPKLPSEYGLLLRLLQKTSAGLQEYDLPPEALAKKVAVALSDKKDREGDKRALLHFCKDSAKVLKALQNALEET